MEMQDLYRLEMIMLLICTFAALVGIVLVILQKKGIITPVLTRTSNGYGFISGGSILLVATLIGAYMLYGHEKLWAYLYIAIFGGAYVVIQILWRKRR